MKSTWIVQIEIPAIHALSDEPLWSTLRGGEFTDRDEAIAAFRKAQKEHEWPLRLMRRVDFQDSGELEATP